jgi:hypothetical protein
LRRPLDVDFAGAMGIGLGVAARVYFFWVVPASVSRLRSCGLFRERGSIETPTAHANTFDGARGRGSDRSRVNRAARASGANSTENACGVESTEPRMSEHFFDLSFG